ncbi:UpxY family transcription antiterminator [Ginsengibacter hankyongi]|uniref:UpxY family transcription antiterminator n=1 Tax=Ginsengibacter hankyongi TaxID=2607284 RepID=A0A5J5IE74_9BACT|nr:UpxY family transcription antiterminator [Ginsengibacter hankyongi]KAA9036369.1 UpxY family transcription antiterminator [Ginsengibacter hankyongi]
MEQVKKAIDETYAWYAVYTKPRWEKKVAEHLQEKGIEHYCPLNKVTRQWSDRKKVVLEPIFKGYVFVKPRIENKWELRKIPGILNFVFWLGRPAQIKEEEILTIKKFLNEFSNVEVEKKTLVPNTPVRITQGILMNYEGMVIEVFGNRAVVKIDSLDIQLSAHFDKKNLELIG